MERDEGLKFMYQLLTMMMQKKGSDLFITAGFPPAMKIDGKMTPATSSPCRRSTRRNWRAPS
jgi:twitching motility protein PilU